MCAAQRAATIREHNRSTRNNNSGRPRTDRPDWRDRPNRFRKVRAVGYFKMLAAVSAISWALAAADLLSLKAKFLAILPPSL